MSDFSATLEIFKDIKEIKDLLDDILNFYENAIKNGCYSNMRMLKNDIEDAINYAILKKREIL